MSSKTRIAHAPVWLACALSAWIWIWTGTAPAQEVSPEKQEPSLPVLGSGLPLTAPVHNSTSSRQFGGSSTSPTSRSTLSLLHAQEREPIAAIGHGGFFDQDGNQIPLTLDFIAKAQAWYRARLLSELNASKKRDFATYEKQLTAGLNLDGQDRLIVQHQALEWLLANISSPTLKVQTAGKLQALRDAMNWKIPEQADLKIREKREPYTPRPEVMKRLATPQLRPMDFEPSMEIRTESITVNAGQAYINECRAAGVPIPPTINVMDPAGVAGWRSEGFIPPSDQFIVGTPAELRSYKSSSPEGMCFALPRYTDASRTTVDLDGVICMGKQSSKVCFWDNQWTDPNTGELKKLSFQAGEQIPIGVPTKAGGKYQAGGKEIERASGGICTDCHAGENPYIIHPKTNLATSGTPVLWESLSQAPRNLPTMPVNRYDPLVAATWPQNQASQAASTVPGVCSGCHSKGSAGRFPHLSNQIPGYCSTILAQAFTRTMPPGSPGSQATAARAFRDMWCNAPPNPSSADDEQATTINSTYQSLLRRVPTAAEYSSALTYLNQGGTQEGLRRRLIARLVSGF